MEQELIYRTRGEEWCRNNADQIDWNFFECDMSIFSPSFVQEFIDEIKIYSWRNDYGQLHREGAPAIIKFDCIEEWLQNGELHREGGPAIVIKNRKGLFPTKSHEACTLKKEEVEEYKFKITSYEYKMLSMENKEIIIDSEIFPGIPLIKLQAHEQWFENGILHRVVEPAVVFESGHKEWWLNGKIHRTEEEGPAIEYAGGSRAWCQHGKIHREDGPAYIWADGTKEWYLNGKKHREERKWANY